ncbi:unknown protein [Waddlia chondrophila 2032/99]|uniref:Uncharacterized protein n=1 Tax=Waddlia chondrophila 2032/99 TaxID=765953 RepID=F8LA42_9BACT|nr:unknown protein [Waddlia chondrophila 2032/99]
MILRPACITQPIQVELLQRRLCLTQIQGNSLSKFQFLKLIRYNCFDLKDILFEQNIILLAKRGNKAKNRVRSISEERSISSKRQIVETAFNSITTLFPRNIKASTERGFLTKIICFVIGYSTSFLCPMKLI